MVGILPTLSVVLYPLWESKLYIGGGTAAVGSGESVQDSIESMDPKDDEGFQQFREALVKKITQYEVITVHMICTIFYNA